jgi:hypothetical protein
MRKVPGISQPKIRSLIAVTRDVLKMHFIPAKNLTDKNETYFFMRQFNPLTINISPTFLYSCTYLKDLNDFGKESDGNVDIWP